VKGRESGVVRECLQCFAHHGFQVLDPRVTYTTDIYDDKLNGVVWRNNVGGMRDRSGRFFVRFGIAGTPDIIGFTRGGLFIGCECKADTGKLSDAQKWFHHLLLRLGGYAFVARSYQECDKWLKEAGL
jgi:hypothetical protein